MPVPAALTPPNAHFTPVTPAPHSSREHLPATQVRPVGQLSLATQYPEPPSGVRHWEFSQVLSVGQDAPQVPQCSLVEEVSTHALLQQTPTPPPAAGHVVPLLVVLQTGRTVQVPKRQ